MKKENYAPQNSFREFISFLKEREQCRELTFFAALIVLIGVVFYFLYPFPFTFPDSAAYVATANDDIFNVFRPMGYSTYLSALHVFSSSTVFVYAVSYLLNAMATLLLLYSAKFLLQIRRKWLFWLLAGFSIVAPRLIFSTNFIMSDSLFNSLTTLFITTAIWLVFRRSWIVAVAHLLIFILMFKVRYSGMFFMPVSMIALFISFRNTRQWSRAVGVAVAPLLIFGILYVSTRNEYREVTGVDTFSAFGGWQLINNASVLLPQAKELKANVFDSPDLKLLHSFINYCPDSLFSARYAMKTDYMWDKDLAYKQFLFYNIQSTGNDYSTAWVELGTLYGEYATQLIKHYPWRYVTQFVVPSLLSNFSCGDMYEERSEFKNEPLYVQYYGIEGDSFSHRSRVFTALYPIRRVMNLVYWIALALAVIYFVATIRKQSLRNKTWQASAMLLCFMLIYLGTSALASPNTTWRYMMPLFLTSLVFIFYCGSKFLDRISKNHFGARQA